MASAKLTKPQLRMLSLLRDGRSHPRWRLLYDSKSHRSGYRVLEALYDKGCIGPFKYSHYYKITTAGLAALPPIA